MREMIKDVSILIRVTTRLNEDMNKYCKENNISKSEMIRKAVKEYIFK